MLWKKYLNFVDKLLGHITIQEFTPPNETVTERCISGVAIKDRGNHEIFKHKRKEETRNLKSYCKYGNIVDTLPLLRSLPSVWVWVVWFNKLCVQFIFNLYKLIKRNPINSYLLCACKSPTALLALACDTVVGLLYCSCIRSCIISNIF